MNNLRQQARQGIIQVAQLSSEQKTQALLTVADTLLSNTQDIMAANRKDLEHAVANDMDRAMQDRLMLDEPRIKAIAQAVIDIAHLNPKWSGK